MKMKIIYDIGFVKIKKKGLVWEYVWACGSGPIWKNGWRNQTIHSESLSILLVILTCVFCVKFNPPEMTAILSHHHRLFSTATRLNSATRDSRRRRGSGTNSVRCADVSTATNENRRVTVSNRSDSLEICRVLNGMWQTSGGWGRIDRDDAVEAMLRYADAGLSTFDMADHCRFTIFLLAATLCWCGHFLLAVILVLVSFLID